MMSVQIALAIILQRYHLTPVPNAKIECSGIRGPEFKYGLPMNINSVNGKAHRAIPVNGNINTLIDFKESA